MTFRGKLKPKLIVSDHGVITKQQFENWSFRPRTVGIELIVNQHECHFKMSRHLCYWKYGSENFISAQEIWAQESALSVSWSNRKLSNEKGLHWLSHRYTYQLLLRISFIVGLQRYNHTSLLYIGQCKELERGRDGQKTRIYLYTWNRKRDFCCQGEIW